MIDFPRIEGAEVTLDTETTGLRWWEDRVFGVALAVGPHDFYWDVRKSPGVLRWLNDNISLVSLLIFHNGKFDIHMLREAGVIIPDYVKLWDTMTAQALLDEHRFSYDLDSVAKDTIGSGKDETIWAELAAIFGGNPTREAQAKNLQHAPSLLVGRYAKRDVRATAGVKAWQITELNRQCGNGDTLLRDNIFPMEFELPHVLADIEKRGVRVDVEKANRIADEIDRRTKDSQHELNKVAGVSELNVNSPTQLVKLFNPKLIDPKMGIWELPDGTTCDSTPGLKPSITKDVVEQMQHPTAKLIINVKRLRKASEMVRGHILGHHRNGYVHCNYNQTKTDESLGTITGRLSVNDPALQQMHKRDKELAALVRGAFIPDEGDDWLSLDWQSFEFRMFAHYLDDERITSQYARNPDADFHQLVADMAGIVRSPTAGIKGNAKQLNLSMVFGAGPGKTAWMLGLPFTRELRDGRIRLKPGPEAVALFDKYHRAIPGVRQLLDGAASTAKSRGYVRSIFGRRLRFPRGMGTHKAAGLIFQGSAADSMKRKMIELHKTLKNTDARIVLSVHDELNFSMRTQGQTEEIKRVYTRFDGVETPFKFKVPIRCDAGVGPNWWEACK